MLYNLCNIFLFKLQVLHSLVCNVVKQKVSQSGHPLQIHCKNFQVIQFIIPQESECHDVYISLSRLSRPGGLCIS